MKDGLNLSYSDSTQRTDEAVSALIRHGVEDGLNLSYSDSTQRTDEAVSALIRHGVQDGLSLSSSDSTQRTDEAVSALIRHGVQDGLSLSSSDSTACIDGFYSFGRSEDNHMTWDTCMDITVTYNDTQDWVTNGRYQDTQRGSLFVPLSS